MNKVIERALPALDDAFAQKVSGLPTLAALRARVEQDVADSQRKREEQEYEIAIIDELLHRATISELPEKLVSNELDRLLHELKHDVEHRGMKYADYLSSMRKDEIALRKELLSSAERRVKTELVIRKISELEQVAVSESAIEEEIKNVRQSFSAEEQQRLKSDDLRNFVKTTLIHRKAIDAVKAKQKTAS